MRRLAKNTAAATALACVLTLSGIGVAYAYFTSGGTGTGRAATAIDGTPLPVSLSPATAVTGPYPGGSATVTLTVTNTNTSAVRVDSLALDTTQGTSGFAVDANHTACNLDAFTFPNQTNTNSGWTIPPADTQNPGTLTITLASSFTASTTTSNACQGATLTVYLKAAPRS